MSALKISQREARRLRKRVQQLEREQVERTRRWSKEYPGGVHIKTWTPSEVDVEACRVASALGHALVLRYDNGKLYLYAVEAK